MNQEPFNYQITNFGNYPISRFADHHESFNHQFPSHVVMVRPADDTADDLVFTFGGGMQDHRDGLARLNGLLDAQFRDIEAVLHVGGGNQQLDGLAAPDADYRRIDAVFFHDHPNMLGGAAPASDTGERKREEEQKDGDDDKFLHMRFRDPE